MQKKTNANHQKFSSCTVLQPEKQPTPAHLPGASHPVLVGEGEPWLHVVALAQKRREALEVNVAHHVCDGCSAH